MSSKSRRNRGRDKRRNQHLNHPLPSPAAWPNRTPLPGQTRPNGTAGRGAKTSMIAAVMIVIAGLVVYAISSSKSGQNSGGLPKTPETASSKPQTTSPMPAPSRPVSSGPKIQFASPIYDFGKITGDELVNCQFVFTNT